MVYLRGLWRFHRPNGYMYGYRTDYYARMSLFCLFGRSLNVMQLDEEQAQQLGINVEMTTHPAGCCH